MNSGQGVDERIELIVKSKKLIECNEKFWVLVAFQFKPILIHIISSRKHFFWQSRNFFGTGQTGSGLFLKKLERDIRNGDKFEKIMPQIFSIHIPK